MSNNDAASSAAEAAIKKLAKLPGNTICPNCETTNKFGFSTVCMKSLAFVCNNCKSGHQAISHRCKSLTMSLWTDSEIIQMKTDGGNDKCRITWLANAPPIGSNGRPNHEHDPIDIYKSFIITVYEHKKYYKNNNTSTSRSSTGQKKQHQQQMHTIQPIRPPRQLPSAPAKKQARPPDNNNVAESFSFDAFGINDDKTTMTTVTTTTTTASTTARNNNPTKSNQSSSSSSCNVFGLKNDETNEMFLQQLPQSTPKPTKRTAVAQKIRKFFAKGGSGGRRKSQTAQYVAHTPPSTNFGDSTSY